MFCLMKLEKNNSVIKWKYERDGCLPDFGPDLKKARVISSEELSGYACRGELDKLQNSVTTLVPLSVIDEVSEQLVHVNHYESLVRQFAIERKS